MTEPTLAEQAETTGFMVFKLGVASTFLGVVVGVAVGAGDSGWQPMQTWFTYSLAVTVAGAILGSVGGLGRAKVRTARSPRIDLTPPTLENAAVAAQTPRAVQQRPAVSAFRARPKVSAATGR